MKKISILLLIVLLISCKKEISINNNSENTDFKLIFHFDEEKGNTIINSAGTFPDGIIYGSGRLDTGVVKRCLNFEYGNYALIPALGKFKNNELMIDFWIKFHKFPILDTSQNIQHIFGDQFYGVKCFVIYGMNNRLFLDFDDGTKWQTAINTNDKLIDNEWYYVAFKYDGRTAEVFINGALNNSKLTSFGLKESLNTLNIGGFNYTFSGNHWLNQFYGELDELRVYNVLKSQEYLMEYYKSTKLKKN